MESRTCYSLTDWGPELWALDCVSHCSSLIIRPPPPIPPLGPHSMNVCTRVFVWLRALFKTREKKEQINRKHGWRKRDSIIISERMEALGSVWWFWVGFLSAKVHTSGKHLPVFFLDSRAIDKHTGGRVMIKLLLWLDFIFRGWTCQKWSVFTTSVQPYLYKHQQFLCHWFSCFKLQTQINRWGVFRIKFRFVWRLHARVLRVGTHMHTVTFISPRYFWRLLLRCMWDSVGVPSCICVGALCVSVCTYVCVCVCVCVCVRHR